MADDHHIWQPGYEPPVIRAHSLAKHRVVAAYLQRYVEVLTSNPRIPEFRLTLIDGFAGGGLYRDWQTGEPRPGSPLIMLESMKSAERLAQEKRAKDFRLITEYFFVERSEDTRTFLELQLRQSEFGSMIGSDVHVMPGEFVEQIPAIITHIKSRGRGSRAIFLLDQCGYSDVPIAAIRDIISELPNAEVILTFAVDSLIDYLGTTESTQRILQRLGISLSPSEISSAKERGDWRQLIQRILHREIHENSGACFYTPFFIRSHDAHRDYWLIHLSSAARARDVMVGLHWQENTSFAHYGRSGLQMLGYNPLEDLQISDQRILPGFFFDQTALDSSQEALIEQLPERLFNDYRDGTTFGEFFAAITNESPATSEIIKSVLRDLARENVVEIRGPNGEKRAVGVQRNTDVLKMPQQLRLFGHSG